MCLTLKQLWDIVSKHGTPMIFAEKSIRATRFWHQTTYTARVAYLEQMRGNNERALKSNKTQQAQAPLVSSRVNT